MTNEELDLKMTALRDHALKLTTELVRSMPNIEQAVALGALSAVVTVLISLLPREAPPAPAEVSSETAGGPG